MDSIWTKTAQLPQFEPLRSDLRTDVLVIGGGMAGLLCAWRLRQAGVDCVLVEADRLCGGTTKNTTAKLTVQHGLIYHRLLKELGLTELILSQDHLHTMDLYAERRSLFEVARFKRLLEDNGIEGILFQDSFSVRQTRLVERFYRQMPVKGDTT